MGGCFFSTYFWGGGGKFFCYGYFSSTGTYFGSYLFSINILLLEGCGFGSVSFNNEVSFFYFGWV